MIAARGRRGRRAGYTAVEVLMAMTVMAVGAGAVISMQKASVLGNFDAREADIANSVARTWVERIQRDAMQWTAPGPSNPAGNNLSTAAVVSYGVNNPGGWFLPNQYIGNTPPISPGFDILGRDLATDALPTAVFCAHVRFTQLDGNLYRADVRVLWLRGILRQGETQGPASPCDPSVVGSVTPDPRDYHAIYLTTAIESDPQ